jgi:hypothetical protein
MIEYMPTDDMVSDYMSKPLQGENSGNFDGQLWDSMVSFYTRLLYKIRDYKTRVYMSQAYKIGLSDDSNVTHYFNNTTSKAMPLLPSAPPGARTLPFDELLMQGMAIRGQHGQCVNCSQCRRMLAPGEGCAKCMTDPSNEAFIVSMTISHCIRSLLHYFIDLGNSGEPSL